MQKGSRTMMNTSETAGPLVRFVCATPGSRRPQRADRTATGILPARAAQYCDAVTSASAFGWYLFAPIDLSLLWDGSEVFWTYAGADHWMQLGAAQFPGFAAMFDRAAPAELAGCSPPFVTALPEPGVVQLWTGLFARTLPGWSLLLRPVVNAQLHGGFMPFEGIVETDRWFGPLFTNLRLTRTGTPIRLDANRPLIQAQPVPRALYGNDLLDRMNVVDGIGALTQDEWDAYRASVVEPNARPDRPFGAYAAAARRERRCPMA
jgi:hypothetical protein